MPRLLLESRSALALPAGQLAVGDEKKAILAEIADLSKRMADGCRCRAIAGAFC